MSHHAEHEDDMTQPAHAEEPIAATRREQRERDAASAAGGTQAGVRQDAVPNDTSHDNAEREAAARQDAAQYAGAGDLTAEGGAAPESVAHSATTDHDVIRQWAEDRHATPATVEGAAHDGDVGELRLDFDFGNDLEDLKEVSWDDWFRAFDERGLEFVFQESTRPDGSASNDFSLEQAGRART